MSVKPFISFEQAQSAMKLVIEDVTKPGGIPVAVSIVDDVGNMVAYAHTNHVRLYGSTPRFSQGLHRLGDGHRQGFAWRTAKKERGRTVSD